MSKRLEFFFDVGSPTTYLAWTQVPAIAERRGAELDLRPFLLGGVFKATGNASPVTIEPKGKYLFKDIERCARRFNVPFRLNPHFPINTLALMRGAVAAKMDSELERYLDIVFPDIWEHGSNMADPDVVGQSLSKGGLDPQRFAARIQEDEVKQALIEATREAVERGAFGWGWDDVLPFFRKMETDVDYDGPMHGHDGPMAVRRIFEDRWPGFTKGFMKAAQAEGYRDIGDKNAVFEDGYFPIAVANSEGRRTSTARSKKATSTARKRTRSDSVTSGRTSAAPYRSSR